MNLDLSTVYLILWIILAGIGATILMNLLQSTGSSKDLKLRQLALKMLSNKDIGDLSLKKALNIYFALADRAKISTNAKEGLKARAVQKGLLRKWQSQLSSRFKLKRMRSALYIAEFGDKGGSLSISERLEVEDSRIVRLFLIYALAQMRFVPALPIILDIASLSNVEDQRRIAGLCQSFGADFSKILTRRIERVTSKELPFLFTAAQHNMTLELTLLLSEQAKIGEYPFRVEAAQILKENAPHVLHKRVYLEHEDSRIRGLAYQALVSDPTDQNLKTLFAALKDDEALDDSIVACSSLLRRRPDLIPLAIDIFNSEEDAATRKSLAKILSFRIEFFLEKLKDDEDVSYRMLIIQILQQHEFSAFIAYMNLNQDQHLISEVIDLLEMMLPRSPELKKELQLYLRDELREQLGLDALNLSFEKPGEEKERVKIRILVAALFIAVLGFPLGYGLMHFEWLSNGQWRLFGEQFIISFNYALIYYSASLNFIYIMITLLSRIGISEQLKMWRVKSQQFLHTPEMLPSVTIIAPAYGEEATIIESTNSLLNLKYPDYELVVVNDGSPDSTLSTLIDYYNLKKIDRKLEQSIATMPVRGFYANPHFPRLLVIDKANGGKADSLNVGINASSSDYVCGIDADSLLEPDALNKIASTLLDSEDEGLAAGGNIMPINGCRVSKGHLDEIHIPKNSIARFQTVEYLRAFMTGRVGWADMKCLLIISGAFGLFKRSRVIQVGGYLTASGQFRKDTVGEDMELVVRLVRQMMVSGIKHKVHYSYLANCWTEVPESNQILYRQRDRWQRGLLDILTFHRSMLFNPRYKQVGFIALPYFTIFEAIGPLIEAQGYLMVVLAAIFGLLNEQIALLLFIASVLMGVLNSLIALQAAGTENKIFSFKDRLILMFYAIIENFGYRQIQLVTRLSGYFNSLKKPKGWGKMVRKGIGAAS